MTAIHETTAVTEQEGKGSRPVALFVGLDHETGKELEGLKQEFQASNATSEPLIITEVAKQDGALDKTLNQIETTLDRYGQSEIDLIQICATPTNKKSLGNNSEFLDILFKLVVDAKPRLLLLDGLGVNARVTIQKLIDEEPVGCCIVVDHIQGTKLAGDLIADFYSLLLAGVPAKEAFSEVNARMKQRFNDVDKNLPWNITGNRTNVRFGETVIKTKKRSLLAKIFGQPEYPGKPPVALLIQAAGTQGDIAHSQEEIDDIKDALDASEHCQVEPVKNATVEIVRRKLRSFGKRIEIIHFAGHANGESILLKADDDEKIEPAYIAGLARDFNAVEPKLIFINGCSSEQQVAEFRDIPERAWSIMTDSEIDDGCARRLAKEFYKNLANGNGIDAAFDSARDRVEETLKDRFGRKAVEGAYRSAVHGEGKAVRQARYQFPWKLYPSSQKWRLGMTELEENVNDWKPGWRLENVVWKPPFLNVQIPFGVLGLVAICLLAGLLSWIYAVRSPDRLLTQDWVVVDAKDFRKPIKIDLKKLNQDSEANGSVGTILWPINEIVEVRNQDIHLILPETVSDDLLAQFRSKHLSLLNAPSLGVWRIFLALVGFVSLFFLIRALTNFGCWHVRGGFKKTREARQENASLSARFFASAKAFFTALGHERQGTAIVFGCLVGLAPFLYLPLSDFFDRNNSVANFVKTVTIDAATTDRRPQNFRDDSSLMKLATYFPELESLQINNAIVSSKLVEQLKTAETAYEKRNRFGPRKILTIDVDPKENTFVTPYINDDQVVRLNRDHYPPETHKVLELDEQSFHQNLKDRIETKYGKDLELSLSQVVELSNPGRNKTLTMTITDWPLPDDRESANEPSKIQNDFEWLLLQLSRIKATIKIKEELIASSSKIQVLDILHSLAKQKSLVDRLYGLDLSENVLVTTRTIENGTSARVSSDPSIRRFHNLKLLNITGCKVDKQQLEELLGEATDHPPTNAPLKKLRKLICNHNAFRQEELETIIKWRITSNNSGLAQLGELRSDAWAKRDPEKPDEKIYEILQQAQSRTAESEYGVFRINYYPKQDIELRPAKVSMDDPRAIKFLKYFYHVPELSLDFGKDYKSAIVHQIAQETSVNDYLNILGVQESKEFLSSVFDDDGLIRHHDNRPGPKRLMLNSISPSLKSKQISLDFAELGKSRISELTIDGPLDILGINGLTRPLERLVINGPRIGSLSRVQRILPLIPPDDRPRPRIRRITITDAVVHTSDLEELLKFQPEYLDLSKCEWDNTKREEFDFDQFKRLFEKTNENGEQEPISTEIHLPYVVCSDEPKLKMPILTFSQLAKIEHFKKMLDKNGDKFLRRTRILHLELQPADQQPSDSLLFIGSCSDIRKTLDVIDDATLQRLNRLHIKIVNDNAAENEAEENEQSGETRRQETFAQIAAKLGYDANDRPRLFQEIKVKGEDIGDELPENLQLKSVNYDFTGCTRVTPNGVYELGKFRKRGSAIVLVGGAMGIGDIEFLQGLPRSDQMSEFRVDFSNALITKRDQKELSLIKVFSPQSNWKTSNFIDYESWSAADPNHLKKLWNLNNRIERFLQSADTAKRALELAGAEPDHANEPIRTAPTPFEQLNELQVQPGYWPLYLVTKAAIASERGDHKEAERFVSEALDLVDTIRKDYWNEKTMVTGRQNYRNKFEALLEEYQELNESTISSQNVQPGETTDEN